MRRSARGLLVGLASLALGSCSLLSGRFGDLKTADHVDLSRYMGHWRVLANIPYFAEDGCVDSIESYALRPDGDIDNWFSCRKQTLTAPLERRASARARVVNHASNAEWNVRFFKILNIKYVVLAVDPEYEWAAVAHPSREYGWILARGTTLDAATYAGILERFAAAGYDTTRFVRIDQPAVASVPPPFR